MIPNVLAERYAAAQIRDIWSPEGRIILERDFWIAVMKAQQNLGLDIPAEAIAAYESVKGQVNLAAIDERERITRHDVKARIEEFNDLAGHEHIHKGMTSRDLTENVEQLQVYRSLEVIRNKTVAVLARMSERADQWSDLMITARTHNVAAQPTTFGKRLSMFGEELLSAFIPLVAGEVGCHGKVPFEDGMETVNAFTGTGVHLVRHCGGTGLTLGESFAGGLVTGHQAEGLGEGRRTGGKIDKRTHDAEVE